MDAAREYIYQKTTNLVYVVQREGSGRHIYGDGIIFSAQFFVVYQRENMGHWVDVNVTHYFHSKPLKWVLKGFYTRHSQNTSIKAELPNGSLEMDPEGLLYKTFPKHFYQSRPPKGLYGKKSLIEVLKKGRRPPTEGLPQDLPKGPPEKGRLLRRP